MVPNGFRRCTPRSPHLIREFGLNKNSYLLFVGRLVPEKGCEMLLEAFGSLRTSRQLVVAGNAARADDYTRKLDTMRGSMQRVAFVGFVRGALLEELYSNAYVVVQPSQVEGLSISLLEALSCGNCLVVSDVPENVEAIGDDGYTFRSGDTADLARILQELEDAPEKVEAARARARERSATMMDWGQVARETLLVYRRTGPGSGRGRTARGVAPHADSGCAAAPGSADVKTVEHKATPTPSG
jgi:glycosyltransferase involved in cell wall biosynthesis